MLNTVCLQLLALLGLAILWLDVAHAKEFQETENKVLDIEKKDLQAAEEIALKRDLLNKENVDKLEKRDKESQEAEVKDVDKLEKRDKESQEDEVMEKRDEEKLDDKAEQDEKVEKREKDKVTQEETAAEEKRDEAAVSAKSKSEAEEIENLETRSSVRAAFTLVDGRGHRLNSQTEGLLLYNGGTVCDDGFSMNSAHAVCRTMGFSGATRWRHGLVYGSFQRRKTIRLDDVICSSTHWSSCRATTRHNCGHHEDVLLTCHGTGFKLVNSAGTQVTGRREGLLTFQDGTVCDDYFSMYSAHAICRQMGFASAVTWTHGNRWSIQRRKSIHMDDVRCSASYWNYCTYRSAHNCGHYEDVFLTCQPGSLTRSGARSHRFTLVDWRGHTAQRGCEGLLLYNGGTVCDDYFNMTAAHAICRALGYRSAVRFRNGHAYGAMQTRKRITMDDVRCSSTSWSSCHFTTRHNCSHGEDVLLTCQA